MRAGPAVGQYLAGVDFLATRTAFPLSQVAARLEADVSWAKDAAKVRMVAGVVKELATEPRLARGQ
jgi:hypothetical protein